MTSTFSFGFSGDDIETGVDENENENENETQTAARLNNLSLKDSSASLPKLVEAERYQLDDWIHTLPSQISYNKLNLNIPTQPESSLRLGRREVFDIRAQLMAEDEDEADHEELIAGLEQGDIKPFFYEGGFKTWECALDLARLMASGEEVDALGLSLAGDDDEEDGEDVHVIELGCGTAMPSLAIFAQLLARPPPTSPPRRKFSFTLADYNATVLRLVTLPNLLLTWKLNTCPASSEEKDAGNNPPETENRQTHADENEKDEGDLDVDPALLDAFQNDLVRRGISVDFVAGGWSPRFVDLALTSREHALKQCPSQNSTSQNKNITSPSAGSTCTCTCSCRTLLLASETIYSPASLTAFSETVLELLRRSCSAGPGPGPACVSISGNNDNGNGNNNGNGSMSKSKSMSKALIAAKKVYFGVGGGIDEFLHVLYQRPQENEIVNVKQRVDVKTEGVGRVILEIGLEKTSS